MRKSISFSTRIKEDALWHINETKFHQSKISNASISVDDEPPHIYKHIMLNHKKMHQTEGSYLIIAYYKSIEQGNQRLLKRIQKILHRNSIESDMNSKSLNYLIRKKQLIKITTENKVPTYLGN
jgi:replicative DNA helicase